MVEKPLTSNTKELDQLEMIAKKNNLVVMVGHTFLYNTAVRYVKNIIDSGEIGDIRYIYTAKDLILAEYEMMLMHYGI